MSSPISTDDRDFCSLDDDKGWSPFMIALLRLGAILTKDGDSVREMMDTKVCKLLSKYRNQIHHIFRPKELRNLLEYECPEIRGGGVKVEWIDITYENRPRAPKRYYFNFDRIYRPEEVMTNEKQPSPTI